MGNKVVFEEHPPPADLGAGNASCLGTLAQFFSVHVQEGGGFVEV